MAKKPMTKSQIVSYFAEKFELSRKAAGAIIDEVAALAISESIPVSFKAFIVSGEIFMFARKRRSVIRGCSKWDESGLRQSKPHTAWPAGHPQTPILGRPLERPELICHSRAF